MFVFPVFSSIHVYLMCDVSKSCVPSNQLKMDCLHRLLYKAVQAVYCSTPVAHVHRGSPPGSGWSHILHSQTQSPQEAHPGPAHSSGPRGLPTPHWSSSHKGLGPADTSWVPGLCSNITHHGAPSPGPGLPRPPSSPPGPRPGDTRATGGWGTRHPPRQLSPCSQFLPPKRSGHSHRYVFQPLTQVPPF